MKPLGTTDDYLGLIEDEELSQSTALRQSMLQGVQENPDSFAKIKDLSRQTGLPTSVVKRDPARVEQKARFKPEEYGALLKDYPETARWLSDKDNAALAHDDLEGLKRAERLFTEYDIGRLRTAGSQVARGAARMGTEGVKSFAVAKGEVARHTLSAFDRIDRGEPAVALGAPTPRADLVDQYRTVDEDGRAALRADVARQMDPRAHSAWQVGVAMQEAVEEALVVNPEYAQEFWAGKVPEGFGSMLGYAFTTAVTRNPMLSGFFAAGTMAPSGLEDALKNEASIEDALTSAGLNAVAGFSEILPITRMLDRVDKLGGGSIKRALVDMLKAGTEEAIQEAAQTIWSNLVASDVVGYDSERNAFTGAGEGAGVGFTVGALTQALVSMLLPGKGGSAQQPPQPEPLEQLKIDELHEVAAQTRVRERAPETFAEHLAQLEETYGSEESIYIPADHLAEAMEGVELEPEARTPAVEKMLEDMTEAADTGADLVIPVSTYVSGIAPHLGDQLREIVRLSPDSLSVREAKEVDPEDPNRAQVLIEEANKNVERKAQIDARVEDLTADLVRTGVVAERNARVYARVVSSWVSSFAERTGMDPDQVFEEMGLRVQGPGRISIPEQIFERPQDFGDLVLEEDRQVVGTGEVIRTRQRAQDVWENTQDRREKITELMECLYG